MDEDYNKDACIGLQEFVLHMMTPHKMLSYSTDLNTWVHYN